MENLPDSHNRKSVVSHQDVERAIDNLTERLERIEMGRRYKWHRRWRMLLRRLRLR